MKIAIVIVVLVLLVVAYFFVGILIKFLLNWWIMIFGLPVLAWVGLTLGWGGAIGALLGLFLLVAVNSQWEGCSLYMRLAQKVDKVFYLGDS